MKDTYIASTQPDPTTKRTSHKKSSPVPNLPALDKGRHYHSPRPAPTHRRDNTLTKLATHIRRGPQPRE